MKKEVWLPVPGYPNYEASSLGRIKNAGVARRASKNRDGYMRMGVVLSDGRKANRYVHQMVAAAFIGERPEGWVTRHLDGDPLNNNPENLAYGTVADNMADRRRHGNNPAGARNGRSKLNPQTVRLVRLAREHGASYHAIARAVAMNHQTIRDVCNRKLWKDVA